ncbi:MAG: dihydrolipoyl dehydrogenase [Oscillospiraceae bacterium]
MAVEVTMPKLGLTMTEGTVERWHKKEGDIVDEGETIVEIATDKLTNEIQAECGGVLLKIVAEEGTEVPVKGVLAYIGEAGETVESGEGAAAPKSDAESAPAGSVLVIGGGPGGYVAAIRAAQLGAKTTLIEKSALGGTCLNVGCMPTKALLHSAQVYELATKSESCGIIGESVLVDWKKVQANRASVTEKLTNGVKALVKVNKIKLVDGQAVFIGPKSVRVGDSEYTADKVIIASGSHPIIPDIPGVSSSKACIDSTGALTLDHVPESMVIIGGGVIGLELGSVYNSFGTEVTVIEAMPKLLPLMDAELTAIVRAQLEGKGIKILTDSRVLLVSDGGKGALVEAETPEGNKTYEAEKVLLCVGRAPNTDGLGLDQAGIEKKDGCIKTNEYLETSVPGVYAVGDCTGKMMLAHAAMMMGEAAAENAMGGSVRFDPDTVPACAFVGPEFAGVGLTEEAASSKGIKVKVGRFPMSANGRSLVMGYTDGMIKVVADAEYGEILGVHILAANAADIIEEAALAMKLECTLDELTETVHCHPTVSEALREASLAADKKAVHTVNR